MQPRDLAPITLITLGIALAGCSGLAPVARSALAQPAPTATAPPPTATATVTLTSTPSPTPTPHPLSIEFLRESNFPGSVITIEEVLSSGANYHRYLASYWSEGLRIYALLTVPFGEPPASGWPTIIFNHGFIPPDEYRTTERYVAYVDGFARNGYIVFRSDYRGHGDSDGLAQGGYGSPDYTIDVLNALAAIRNFELADPARVGMWGHSMGGYITLRAMVASGDIRAGVIWAGVVASYSDLLERWRRSSSGPGTSTPTPRGWRGSLVETYGSPQENPQFWQSVSANAYLQDLSGPVQLHHGTADTSVPLEFSILLNEQIQAAGGTVEYYEYPGDNHNLSNYFTSAMQRSVEFFDRFVKGN